MAGPTCKQCGAEITGIAISFNLVEVIENSDDLYTEEHISGLFSGHLCVECLP